MPQFSKNWDNLFHNKHQMKKRELIVNCVELASRNFTWVHCSYDSNMFENTMTLYRFRINITKRI